jgi:hypothetical protein
MNDDDNITFPYWRLSAFPALESRLGTLSLGKTSST